MSKIDVLVTNFNTQSLLKRFLDTLHSDAGNDPPWKLYVADNGSTDGSIEWLRESAHNYKIEEIDYNENIGYARANNKMAAKSNSKYLAIMNADTWMYTRDVLRMIHAFESIVPSNVGIMGPKQRDSSGRIRHAGIVGDNTRPRHRGWAEYDPEDIGYRHLTDECVTVSGSAYFIKREVWDELTNCDIYQRVTDGAIGAFLPTPLFYEESFCSAHSIYHGWKVYFYGAVSIGHEWAASTGPNDPILQTYMLESRQIYIRGCDAHNIAHEWSHLPR